MLAVLAFLLCSASAWLQPGEVLLTLICCPRRCRGEEVEEAEPERAEAVLGRVQTAPAALSNLAAAASAVAAASSGAAEIEANARPPSAALSATTSCASIDQLGAAEEPPAALPERLHPSVSCSVLEDAALGASSRRAAREPLSPLREGAEERVAGALGAAAAAAAAGAAGASGGSDAEDEASGSEGSDAGRLDPGPNPFDLLGASSGGEEEGEPGELSEAGSTAAAAVEAAARGAPGAADASGVAAAAAAAAAAAEGDPSGGFGVGSAQPALEPGSAAPAGRSGAEALANGHAPLEAGSSGASSASAAARLPSGCTQHSAAPACNGHAGPSMRECGSSSGGSELAPTYRLLRQAAEGGGGGEVIRLSIDLPGVSGEEIDLRVSDDGRQLWLGAPPFAATLPLPAAVAPVQRAVKWKRRSERLVAVFDVLAGGS